MTRSLSPYGDTSVSISQSKANIETLLERYHVTDTRWTVSGSSGIFAIEFNYPMKRTYEGQVKIPNQSGRGSHYVDKYRIDAIAGVRVQIPWPSDDRQQRRLARVLYWHLKSKLEAVEAGLTTFEQEFLPHLHIGAGRTMYDMLAPRIAKARAQGGDLSITMGEELDKLALAAGAA